MWARLLSYWESSHISNVVTFSFIQKQSYSSDWHWSLRLVLIALSIEKCYHYIDVTTSLINIIRRFQERTLIKAAVSRRKPPCKTVSVLATDPCAILKIKFNKNNINFRNHKRRQRDLLYKRMINIGSLDSTALTSFETTLPSFVGHYCSHIRSVLGSVVHLGTG